MSDLVSRMEERRKIRILTTAAIGERVKEPTDRTQIIKGVDVEVVSRRVTDAPVRLVEQDYETDLVAVVHAREAQRADEEGFDAYTISCFNGPGANACKEVCDIPVVDSPMAAMHIANMLGNKFSIIIQAGGYVAGLTRLWDNARHYGLEGRLASIRTIDLPPSGFAESRISKEELENLKKNMLEAAKKCVYEDGADVIISYGREKVNDFLRENLPGVPIVQAHSATTLIAEVLVRLGLSQSKRAYPTPRQLYRYYLREK